MCLNMRFSHVEVIILLPLHALLLAQLRAYACRRSYLCSCKRERALVYNKGEAFASPVALLKYLFEAVNVAKVFFAVYYYNVRH